MAVVIAGESAAIMTRYGPRGMVRSTKWHADTFDPRGVVERAREWIAEA